MGTNDFVASAARPPARPRPGPLAGRLGAGFAAALVVTGAVIAMQPSLPIRQEPMATAAKEAWVELADPPRRFALATPPFEGRLTRYAVRLNHQSGGRVDALTFGGLGTERPFLRLALAKSGTESGPERSFFLAMVRGAAEIGLAVTRSSVGAPLVTRFGTAEVGEVTLAGPSGESRCLGVRLADLAPGLSLAGLHCAADNQPIDRPTLACLIDQLGLVPGQTDERLQHAFAAPLRGSCQALTPRIAARVSLPNTPPPVRTAGGKKITPGKS
jgi:hypothetical protein